MFKKIKLWNTPEKQTTMNERVTRILQCPIPEHVAIIMDGNGRWAKKRALPRVAGHHEGMKTVRKITILADQLNIKTLTLYAFSTENWKRPKYEVDFLMALPEEFLGSFLPELIEKNVRVTMMGDRERIPEKTKKVVDDAILKTKANTGLNLNFALNYGGRAEIIDAVRNLADDVKNNNLDPEDITDTCFSRYLMTQSLSDPDLLIRTSGELRLSNFMLWQIAYTELWFTDVLWPDFSETQLIEAVEAFQQRTRRYGGLNEEESKR